MQARSLPSLKRKCHNLGLSASGTKADMIKRLKSYNTSVTTVDASKNIYNENIDCLLRTSIPHSSPGDIMSTAHTSFQSAAQNEPIEEEEISNKTVIANPQGSFIAHIAASYERTEEVLATLQKGLAKLQKDQATLQKDHAALKEEMYARINEFQRSNPGFRDFRHA